MMESDTTDLPPAPERLERAAQRILARSLSPEEYAGRYGANVLMFSLHRYQYQDPEVTAWIHRFGQILFSPELLEQYQRQYLTPEEFDAVQSQTFEEFLESVSG